jgi:16S rRNA (uracil1498-N3)-methyltransferase
VKSPPWLLVAPGELEAHRIVTLDAAESRHVSGALRRRTGDEIVLADGQGSVALARLVTVGRGGTEAEVVSVQREPEPELPGVTVALAVVSGRTMDWAVQKAVEVGVRRFVPLETDRAQGHGRENRVRVDHWKRVSLQALKQCRRAWAMEVAPVMRLAELVDGELGKGGGVIADRNGLSIDELPSSAGRLLVVGPEGGFSESEDELLSQRVWQRLRLGPYVLRAETAAIVGGAMMVARFESETL